MNAMIADAATGAGGANRPRRALVLGASMAGLWTARVLADHFDEVVVLERDRLPEGAAPRAGVPQARQYHVLLLRGLQLLREYFPGLEEELIAAGAVPFDITGDVKLRSRGKWLRQFPSGQQLLSCSRLLLEAAMRRRLRQDARIRFLEGVEVTGLVAGSGGTRVAGVRYHTRAGAGSAAELGGDLIVDALGRRSPTPAWLQELGYAPPEESVVDSFLGYVTRRYRRPANFAGDWRMLLITATAPHDPRGGLIFPEENGVWVVMMAGANKDYPPTDEAGFDAFARSLGPEYYAAVQAAEPISAPIGYRGTDSRWRHYEKLDRWPERYVVLGDAFCGFNPIYGQGMTVAALSAVALGEEIARAGGQLDGVAARAERAFGKATEGAWLLATGADLEWPETVGGASSNGLADRFGRWYIDKLLDAVGRDEQVRLAFNEVNQLVKPATSLFAPSVMARVLLAFP
ncbi:MAG: FAD-dependent monooxygenase [Caldilineaceae bacterium]|nr:FAD-dependent monooxygenase [Caldilineaceae bacterium]